MEVEIIEFPKTKVAAIDHRGSPVLEHESMKKLIAWSIENKLPPSVANRNYGIHYNDPRRVTPSEYRVDLCISVENDVLPNPYGVVNKVIPYCRCAKAQHIGSRENVTAVEYLNEEWLPVSGEQPTDLPVIFHYVNVGPHVQDDEMITDVYLPLA